MITDHNSLKAAIRDLKSKQALDLEELKSHFHTTFESLKPVNLIKNTVHDIVSSPDIKSDLVNNALGMATGYLSKLIVVGTSHNPVMRVAGALLQQAIGNVVSHHSEKIILGADNLLQGVLKFRFRQKNNDLQPNVEDYAVGIADE